MLPAAPSFWWGMTVAFVGVVVLHFSNYYLRHFVDALTSDNSSNANQALIIITMSYLLSQMLIYVGQMWGSNWNGSWDALRKIEQKIFIRLQELDFAFHSNKSSWAIMSILKQGNTAFVHLGVEFHFRTVPVILEIFVVAYFLFGFSTLVSSIFVGTMVVYFIFITWFWWTQNQARRNLRKAYYSMDSIQVENLTNFDTVKFFSQEKREEEKYTHAMIEFRKLERPYISRYLFLQLVTAGLLGTMLFGCFSVALQWYFAGEMSVGDVTSIVALISVLLPSLMVVANEWRNIMKNLTDLEPFFELLETPNTVIDKPEKQSVTKWEQMNNRDSYTIDYNNITFSYPDRSPIFKNLSLVFEPGKSYGIVGRSWAGKTTLIKLLLRFYDVQQGEIVINGVATDTITKSSLRSKIGIVPQETLLFNDTLRHNIIYGKMDASDEEIRDVLEKSFLTEFVDSLPLGLDTIVGERGIKLSWGQRQRVGIARVFLEDAPIIVFDEATSHLDSESEAAVQSAFWNLAQGKTTIVIAHRLSTLRHCDQILVLQDGSIVEQGTHTDLSKESSGLYHHLLELQKMRDIE